LPSSPGDSEVCLRQDAPLNKLPERSTATAGTGIRQGRTFLGLTDGLVAAEGKSLFRPVDSGYAFWSSRSAKKVSNSAISTVFSQTGK
jgi:hypothetical protein